MNQKDILRAMARIKGSREYLEKNLEKYSSSKEAVEDFDIILECMELQVGKSKEDDIKCPACGTSETEFYDRYEDFFWDGDEYEMVCKKCGKEFSVTAYVEVAFSVQEDSE